MRGDYTREAWVNKEPALASELGGIVPELWLGRFDTAGDEAMPAPRALHPIVNLLYGAAF
jgi:hypothetical protein